MSVRVKANLAKKTACKNLIAVLENPKTIENIGSTLRNLDAFGVEKLYVVDGNHLLPLKWNEMRTRNSLNKISASAIKWKFVRVFQNTSFCIDYLRQKSFTSVATSPHTKGKKNVVLHDGVYTQKRLAVWFGNESQGVSQQAIDNSDFCINIPMCGIIESLNLGTSTGIVFYEVTKQRRDFVKQCEKV